MTALSVNVKNGQQLNVAGGASIIAAGDMVEIGGPGNAGWPVATIDYAAITERGALVEETQIVDAAIAGSSRQPVARDRLGNLYIAGTDSSDRLIVYKYDALGNLLASNNLDGSAGSINTAQIHQLSNGTFAIVYARAAGALRFAIIDSMLTRINSVVVATERAATDVVYHASCALDGGGFAIVYQTSAGTSIQLATYNNNGAVVHATSNIQTLAGGAAQVALKLQQLATGNLVCAYRGTMTAGGTAGTSFTIFTVAGASVAGPTNVDSTSVFGFVELNVMSTAFAIAVADGTNLLASVYNNAGAAQGSQYSVGNTLNSTVFPQVKLTNDGARFVLAWFSSIGFGVYVITFSTAGVAGNATPVGLAATDLAANTYALDAETINGQLFVLAASSGTGGQTFLSIGLPDTNLGVSAPYLRRPAQTFGTAAATTGCNWPRVLSGGGGLYQGASGPSNQSAVPFYNGDFTAILVYDQQDVASTFLYVYKFEESAIVGLALNNKAASGGGVLVNPGQGEYPANGLTGSPGTAFNHLSDTPAGTGGVLYNAGVALTGIATDAANLRPGQISFAPTTQEFTDPGAFVYTPTDDRVLYIHVRAVAGGGGGGGGGGSTGPDGDDGGVTVFNDVEANGGGGGPGAHGAAPTSFGQGGSGGAGDAAMRVTGGNGSFQALIQGDSVGPGGGSAFFGGGAPGFTTGGTNSDGAEGVANTGGGGSGCFSTSASQSSGGGGAGEYFELWLDAPVTVYSGSVGAGGAGGVGTGSGSTGGPGADGRVIVTEFYR